MLKLESGSCFQSPVFGSPFPELSNADDVRQNHRSGLRFLVEEVLQRVPHSFFGVIFTTLTLQLPL